MIEKNTNETAVITSMGRSDTHADTGISCNALHAVQRASITPQLPFKARAARAAKNAPPARSQTDEAHRDRARSAQGIGESGPMLWRPRAQRRSTYSSNNNPVAVPKRAAE